MHQSNDKVEASSLPQALADAALTCLPPPSDQSAVSPPPHLSKKSSPASDNLLVAATPTNLDLGQHCTVQVTSLKEPCTDTQTLLLPSTLPSLLQYVDNRLVQDRCRHDHPAYASQRCVSCDVQWDNVSIPSTFLPLSPCNHWIHYRCLIWLATRNNSLKDKCPACKRRLFEWDGISALTLATRTSLPMDNQQFTNVYAGTQAWVSSDRAEYEQESQFIEDLCHQRFSVELTRPSGYSDGSPDLVQCFNDVLNDLRGMGRPRAKWLRWSTTSGSLLFGVLVTVKMRRYLIDHHGHIRQTEAWITWEHGCKALQRQLLEEVHRQ